MAEETSIQDVEAEAYQFGLEVSTLTVIVRRIIGNL